MLTATKNVYRGDVANRALQMLGAELQMFIPKSEVTHKEHGDLDRLSDLELVELLANEAQQLLLEHKSGFCQRKKIEMRPLDALRPALTGLPLAVITG